MRLRISGEEMAAFEHAVKVLERVFSVARSYFGNGSKYDYLVPMGEEYLPNGIIAMDKEIERLKAKLLDSERTVDELKGQLEMQKQLTEVNRLFAKTLVRQQGDAKGWYHED